MPEPGCCDNPNQRFQTLLSGNQRTPNLFCGGRRAHRSPTTLLPPNCELSCNRMKTLAIVTSIGRLFFCGFTHPFQVPANGFGPVRPGSNPGRVISKNHC